MTSFLRRGLRMIDTTPNPTKDTFCLHGLRASDTSKIVVKFLWVARSFYFKAATKEGMETTPTTTTYFEVLRI